MSKRRWMKSVLEAASKEQVQMPWSRATRQPRAKAAEAKPAMRRAANA